MSKLEVTPMDLTLNCKPALVVSILLWMGLCIFYSFVDKRLMITIVEILFMLLTVLYYDYYT
jgi:hypothetical protein